MSGVENLRPQPFEPGNGAARRHAYYAEVLGLDEDQEIAEIAEALLALSPFARDWGPRLLPLAQLASRQLWRQMRAERDFRANGLVRGAKLAPLEARITTTEKQYVATLDRLGLSPPAAGEMGLTLAKVRELEDGRAVDLERLDTRERSELARLIAKAKGDA